MKYVLALLEEGSEIIDELGDVDLTGLGIGSFGHHPVKILERDALTEVVGIRNIVQHVVKANIMYAAAVKMLF